MQYYSCKNGTFVCEVQQGSDEEDHISTTVSVYQDIFVAV